MWLEKWTIRHESISLSCSGAYMRVEIRNIMDAIFVT